MKILHLMSSLGLGGAEIHTYNIIKHYPAGHEHMIIYVHDGPLSSRFEALGVACHKAPRWITLFFNIQFIRQHKPDVIHAVLWPDAFWGRISSWITGVHFAPFVHYNAETLDKGPSLRSFIDRMTVNLFPARYHAVSTSAANAFEKTIISPAIRLPFSRKTATINVISNGIDTQQFIHNPSDRINIRSQLGIPDDALVIGAVGRFIKLKRFDWLIDRFAQVCKTITQSQNIYLVIVGDGPECGKIKSACQKHGLEDTVIFAGYQLPIAPWYSAFDIFAISSQSEAHSIALLEASAAGLPIVMSCAELPDDTLTNGINGFTVRWDDEKLFEQRLAELINSPELRTQLSTNAMITAQSYAIKTVAQKYHTIFSAKD